METRSTEPENGVPSPNKNRGKGLTELGNSAPNETILGEKRMEIILRRQEKPGNNSVYNPSERT